MAKLPLHPDKCGMNKALDLVEETLAKLREREEQATQNQRLEAAAIPSAGVDAQTSTTNLCPGFEDSKTSKIDTSVLISRRSGRLSSSSKARQHQKHAPEKSKVKKKNSPVLGRSQSRHMNHAPRTKKGHVSNIIQNHRISCNANHPSRCTHRKRSGSFDPYEAAGRSEQSSTNSGDILRHGDSEGDLFVSRKSTSWIPPLSQSSPRELTGGRSKSDSKRSHVLMDNFQEMNIPLCLNANTDSSRDQSSKSSHDFLKPTIPLSCQRYAEPTLTSKLRVKLSDRKEKVEKENMIPFIPSGSTNTSHHVGVIIQQKLGLLKNIPPKELNSITGHFQHAKNDNESLVPTEETVRRALNNIQEHIAQVSKHSSK